MRPLSSVRSRARTSHVVAMVLLCGLFFGPGVLVAQVDLGLVASTEGAGLEIATALNPQWRARFSAVGISHDDDFRAGDIPYQAEADLKWGGAILDWSPGGGAFHLSLGAIFNDHSINGTANVLDLAISEFGQDQVDQILALLPPGTDPGLLRAEVTFNSVSPYVGFGWRSQKPSGIGAAFDIGAIWLGEADATVTAQTGLPLGLIPGGQALVSDFLREQELLIEQEAEDYEIYPVARLSVFYRF